MPWRKPQLLTGGLADVASFLAQKQVTRSLLVCDKSAIERGALQPLFDNAQGVLQIAVYDGVLPNPTVKQVEEGLSLYLSNNCNGIVAFGGGSVMDCAKAIGARVVRPKKTVNQLKGLLKVGKKLPPLLAIPTTSGTGSECTLASVITDSENCDKYAINDFALIPHYALLDPALTVGLPPFLTATTGMDALTHAVEAYIGKSNTRGTKRQAEQAVALILENIKTATLDGQNLTARANMQQAAYLAGLAFTRAYVGYVHALAHSLGGKYGTAHGLANAVLLPVVLEKYGKTVYKKLAKLARIVGIACSSDDDKTSAQKFIQAIYQLNRDLGIPDKLDVAESDIDELSRHAEKEANPLYPVPQLWSVDDFAEVYCQIMK